MPAPFTLANQLIVVPALQPSAEIDLTLDQGASFTLGPLCWIYGGVSFDPSTTTAVATFRQVPTDVPLVTVTSSLTPVGQITYGTPIPNFPWLPDPQAQEPNATPVLLTLFPITVALTVAGVALLIYPFCRWKLNLTWPDTTSVDLAHGGAQINSI